MAPMTPQTRPPVDSDPAYGTPPCEAAPLTWNSTDLHSHAVAAAGCSRCPSRLACQACAFGVPVATGTFGGALYRDGVPVKLALV